MRYPKNVLRALWLGWKVIDDPRVRLWYLFVSPCGNVVRRIPRRMVDIQLRKGRVRRVILGERKLIDQPGLVLTDEGLIAIGQRPMSEVATVQVAGPDNRKQRRRSA